MGLSHPKPPLSVDIVTESPSRQDLLVMMSVAQKSNKVVLLVPRNIERIEPSWLRGIFLSGVYQFRHDGNQVSVHRLS